MALEVKNLTFSYSKALPSVLTDVTFNANDGDFIAVMGPNGVGKSTLFKCILGFLSAYAGTISVDGENTRNMSRRTLAQKIAYIPQSTSQVFDFTVLELVLMGVTPGLKVTQNPSKSDVENCMRVLEELGIENLAECGCGEVSGGELQLVMLARALVQNAKVLILDEPTANLDFGNSFRVMRKIAGLSSAGYTILTSTHDPNQVFLHANRALVMANGQVCVDGTPSDVLTEEVLSKLYSVKVALRDVQVSESVQQVCVPHSKNSEK